MTILKVQYLWKVMALLARARDLTAILKSGEACCPTCLFEVSDGFSSDEAALDEARRELRAFWNACMTAVISAYLTPDYIASKCEKQRRNARIAMDACRLHERPTDRDILHEFVRAACSCLHVALSFGASCAVQRATHSKRALQNRAGSWPRSPAELFGYDPREAAHTMMMWSVQLGTPEPLLLLADMVLVAHPLVCYEVLLNWQLRKELMMAIMDRISDYGHWKMGWPGPDRNASLPQFPPQLRTENITAAVRLLTAVQSGPDALPNAFVSFVSIFDALLFHSLEIALYTMDLDNPLVDPVSALATALYPLIPPPPPERLMWPEIVECVPRYDIFPLFGVVYEMFRTLSVSDTHYCACERCQLARYCGRECQLADWRHGEPARHRAACPLLARIRAATDPDMSPQQFVDALSALEFSRDEKITLSLFTLNPKLVYIPLLPRAAAIHRELLGDDEYPPASAKALALIDRLNKELDDKRSGTLYPQPPPVRQSGASR